MKMATGVVVDGKVVVAGEALEEGATVTVLLRGVEDGFELSPDEEDQLLASINEIEAGRHISADGLFERLRQFG